MRIIWYGHACFWLESKDGSVVFDPYTPGSVPGLILPELTADLVLCSHDHKDHSYLQGVKNRYGDANLTVRRIPTFHDECKGEKRGQNSIIFVEAEGIRMVHLGDLGHLLSKEQIEKIGPVDLIMIPIGGYFTIDAEQARKIIEELKPSLVLPMHYKNKRYGLDQISTSDAFLSGFSNGQIIKLKNNVLELDGLELNRLPESKVIVFSWPEECIS